MRNVVYAKYNDRCGICHASRQIRGVRLHGHESWQYDDEHHVRRLAGFIALCELCHHGKHIGLAGLRASEITLDFQQVFAHFMQVKQCSSEEDEAHRQAAWDTWRERNTHQWVTDLGT